MLLSPDLSEQLASEHPAPATFTEYDFVDSGGTSIDFGALMAQGINSVPVETGEGQSEAAALTFTLSPFWADGFAFTLKLQEPSPV